MTAWAAEAWRPFAGALAWCQHDPAAFCSASPANSRIRILSKRGDASEWEHLTPLRVHGLVAEAALAVRCTHGPSVFASLEKFCTEATPSYGFPQARLGDAARAPARVVVPKHIWESAFACARQAWACLGRANLRMFAGPQRVYDLGKVVAGIDGVAEGSDGSVAIVELQCIKRQTLAEQLDERMTRKAEKCIALTPFLRDPLHSILAVRSATRAFVVTIEIAVDASQDVLGQPAPASWELVQLDPARRLQKWARGVEAQWERPAGPPLPPAHAPPAPPAPAERPAPHQGAKDSAPPPKRPKREVQPVQDPELRAKRLMMSAIGSLRPKRTTDQGAVHVKCYLTARFGEARVRKEAGSCIKDLAHEWGWAVFDPLAASGHGHHLGLFKSPLGTDRARSFWRGTGHGGPWTCRFVDLRQAHCAEHGVAQ